MTRIPKMFEGKLGILFISQSYALNFEWIEIEIYAASPFKATLER